MIAPGVPLKRRTISADVELRVSGGVDEAGLAYVEARLYRRPVTEASGGVEAFDATPAGWRCPAHLVEQLVQDLTTVAARSSQAALFAP